MSKSKVTSAGSDASSPRSVSAGRRKQVHPCDLPTTHIPALGRETVQSPESVSRTPPPQLWRTSAVSAQVPEGASCV